FVINQGEKIGLVGRNGHGKSTFFRILTGHEYPDSGSITLPKDYTLGMVEQHISFSRPTVLEETIHGTEEASESWEAEKILSGLGFDQNDMSRDPSQFSGGYQVRINLARAILQKPNLLLLDEPTNYLDIESIRWLSSFLRGWKNELMLITHDRSFMDSVVTHIVAIHRGQMRKSQGNTEKMYQQIAREEEITEKTRINDEKKRKEIETFISRFRSKARIASRVQSRVKMLERLGDPEKLSRIEDLEFSFHEAPFNAKTLLAADSLTFSYTREPLIQEFSLTINRNDRICIIGRNGKGKTTLMKLLSGSLQPQSGSISMHQQTKIGYFEQTNVSTLDPERTVEQEIAAASEDADTQSARNIAGSMMFSGDTALKKISVLSGGEKARVMLGKILMQPSNLLLLDEPTNHLDMQSCDSLIEAVDSFDGALVMITHNEMFLRAIANRLIVFRRGEILLHEGSYDTFLEKYGWDDEPGSDDDNTPRKEKVTLGKKEIRRIRSEIIREKNAELTPLSEQIASLEESIESQEMELADIEKLMIEASHNGDGSRIQKLSLRSHELRRSIDGSFTMLEKLTIRHEELSAHYERMLEPYQ
ncbi:MAG: ABC-F family ATP-binding cassette domain-containing protein, partial [Spirochaetota bacterium]